MKTLIPALALVLLTGCATQAQLEANANRNLVENSFLNASLKNTRVPCDSRKTCDKAFSLAKIFIQDNADMKIQSSDDTIVSTFGPIKYGKIAMEARRTPGEGDTAEISLNVYCKGLSPTDAGPISSLCKRRVTAINNEFKSYIETKMH